MKLKKLLKKLNAYFDKNSEQRQQTDEGLSKVLKKLKRKEQKIQEELKLAIDDEDRHLLEQELKIVHSQRKKGIELLAQVRKEEKP